MFEQTWQVSGCCGRREEPASQGHHKTICEESVSNQECQLSFVVVVMTCVFFFTVVLMLSFAVCVACAAIVHICARTFVALAVKIGTLSTRMKDE